jgi:hypothetical protein
LSTDVLDTLTSKTTTLGNFQRVRSIAKRSASDVQLSMQQTPRAV